VSVGVVGLGHWGPNLARTFDDLPQAELRWLCDLDLQVQRWAKSRYPQARVTGEIDDLLADETLDAVVIATPPVTHHELAGRALAAHKHVFVEKPLALSSEQAERLLRTAERLDRRLVVGHVLVFHPAVRRLKQLIERGELGDIYYLYGNRQSLGRVRRDENALWSLGAHDLSVILHLLADEPVEVTARGESYVQPGVTDVVFCHLAFATGISAHLHLSWLDPHTIRRLTIVGADRMAVFDDIEPERKLTLYEKSAFSRKTDTFGEYVQVTVGDIVCPRVSADEPLRVECEHFVTSIRSPVAPLAGGREGVILVSVLEAMERSLRRGGLPEPLGGEPDERPAAEILALPSQMS
jgi:predicted dehydrogenase